MSSSEDKKITLEELKEHGEDADSNWLLIHGKVVDVTEYKKVHPGGEDILLENAGTDATEAFENVGHGPDAQKKLESLVIGYTEPGKEKPKSEEGKSTTDKGKDTANAEGESGSIVRYVVPALILLGVAFAIQKVFIN